MGVFILKDLLEQKKNRLRLQLLAGKAGLKRKIFRSQVEIYTPEEKFWRSIKKGAVLIVGRDTLSTFSSLSIPPGNNVFETILKLNVSSIIFSGVNFLPNHLIDFSEKNSIPIFSSTYDEFILRSRIMGILREKIERIVSVQGVFVRVCGVGIIIKGESGLGKSECALELIARGHQMIADDLIEVQKKDAQTIIGRSPENARNLLYIKGIGIINVKDLYGEGTVLDRSRVDIIVDFVEWDEEHSLMGHDMSVQNIMGVNIPTTRIPVRLNQMTTIIEVIAKRFLFEATDVAKRGLQIPGLK